MVPVSGMAVCLAGLGVLHVFLDGSAANLPLVMLALAIFGIGQGLFISPNSGAIMATVPAELTGEAGHPPYTGRNPGRCRGLPGASAAPRFLLGRANAAQSQHAAR